MSQKKRVTIPVSLIEFIIYALIYIVQSQQSILYQINLQDPQLK